MVKDMPAKTPPKKRKQPAKKTLSQPKAGPTLPFEIDPKKLEQSLKDIRDQLVTFAKKGRYTKVRFKFRGKQLLPDIPLAAVVAAEGLTFYWAGLLRVLVFNLAGRTVLDLELVNDSEKKVQQGKEALLTGELDVALALFQEAVEMEPDSANAHLNLGVALKLKGLAAEARASLEKAKGLDPKGPVGAEAERMLATLKPKGSAITL